MSEKPFLRALKGETLERPPFWLMRQAGRYLPEYRATRAEAGGFLDLCFDPDRATEVTLQPIRRYGMDAAILFSDILVVPWGLGQELRFAEGEGPILPPIRDEAGMAGLRLDGLTERLAPVYETVRRLAAALPAETALIGFAGAPWTVACYMVEGRGGKEYLEIKSWAYRDPDGFGRLIDLLVEATVAHLSAQIAAGAEAVQIFDSWAGVLPEDQFRRWVVAPTKAIVAALRARHPGTPIIGFPRLAGPMAEPYVRETGVDCVGIDTAMPLGFAKARLQPLACVQGNLDPAWLVAGGEGLERAARAILEGLGDGPFVFNLGHGVVPRTPPENVARLAELIRGWRR